jgi:outer membrane lipoprotein-sorting protein
MALVVICGALVACTPGDQLSAGEIVARMAKAEAQVEDYHGLVESTLAHPSSGARTLVQEIWKKGPDLLRVEVREGPTEMVGRVAVYNGEQVWFYDRHLSTTQILELDAPLGLARQEMEAAMRASAKDLVQEGTAEYLAEDTVAGRIAHKVRFVPRSGTHLSAAVGGKPITVWIDREHARRLRMEILLPDGGRYIMQYRTLEYNVGLSDRLFQFAPPAGTKAVGQQMLTTPPAMRQVELEEAQMEAGFSLLLPTYLPPGMVFSGATMVGEGESVTLTYRGNGASLTVTEASDNEGIEPPSIGEPILLRGTTGRMQWQGNRVLSLRWQEGGLVIFVSGTTSSEEALKMVRSMQ